MSAPRCNDLYVLDMSSATSSSSSASCFITKATEKDFVLWHKRMGHIHVRKMNQLVHKGLVEGVSVKIFHLPDHCVSCKKGKQSKKAHKSKIQHSIVIPLELLHMDLFGPINRRSIAGDWYYFVVTDEYSRYSWVMFLKEKSETFECFKVLFTTLESLYKLKVRRIRSDNGTEFKNQFMNTFCKEPGIHHEFSAAYVPQMNGVAERKNRTLIEAARTMVADSNLPIQFWNEAIANACYTLNRVLVVKRYVKPAMSFFINASQTYSIWNLLVPHVLCLKGIFLGYSTPNKRVYNKELGNVEEWYEVDVQRYTPPPTGKGLAWMFNYEGLFNSFNLQPLCSDEEVVIQMMYDAQNAPDGQALPLSDPSAVVQSDSSNSKDDDDQEENTQLNDNPVIPNLVVEESSSGVYHEVTNLDPIVNVSSRPVGRISINHPPKNIIGDPNSGVKQEIRSVLEFTVKLWSLYM